LTADAFCVMIELAGGKRSFAGHVDGLTA
jgi:hypothetical protein